MRTPIWTAVAFFSCTTQACIWDSKTLSEEEREHPTLAQAILHPKAEKADAKRLRTRILELKEKPKENDPTWWNDLAGAYLRLGQPAEAVRILEPLTNKFANDYGVHANLGTAYHLLGRYADAEREILRDTQINTNAHFGLEKYHLALLQYLSRDQDYRLRHVYVDEFSLSFLMTPGRIWLVNELEDSFKNLVAKHKVDDSERKAMEENIKGFIRQSPTRELDSDNLQWLLTLAAQDEPAKYRVKWDLRKDSKLDDGVIYMATLNPKEPACWVMLGIVATARGDVNLAKAAFEKAIQLGSPQ